jgi:hypothetical protein
MCPSRSASTLRATPLPHSLRHSRPRPTGGLARASTCTTIHWRGAHRPEAGGTRRAEDVVGDAIQFMSDGQALCSCGCPVSSHGRPYWGALGRECIRLGPFPHSPRANAIYAKALWTSGASDEAISVLHESLRLNPLDLGVRMELGTWLMELLRFSEAVRVLGTAARLLPDRRDVADLYRSAQRGLKDQKDR